MTTLSIAVPDAMRQFVEQQAEKEGFSSTAEYVRSLISGAQQRETQVQLETQLLAGLNSGPAAPMTASDWVRIRREVGERLAGDAE